MVDVQGLINRCKEIIKDGRDAIEKRDVHRMVKGASSIENIFRIIYPNDVPEHLTSDNIQKRLGYLYLGLSGSTENAFNHILSNFEGFVEDLEKGILTQKLTNMISLDLYSDLIQQAQELRKHNIEPLNRAACVLTRIVLEDTLKKMCENHRIVPAKPKADQYNIALKGSFVYGEAQKKQVDAWLGIGNTAAHPEDLKNKFTDLSENQLNDMIKQVKEFSDKYLI